MKLIFLHGPAAAGKLTVGRELQALTGLRLFHNHLVVDALLAVFPFGSEPFVRLREEMWLAVFRAAAAERASLIFTFNPEATVRPRFISDTVELIRSAGGECSFVRLECARPELERRVELPSRAEFRKLRSASMLRTLWATGADAFPPLPAGLTIDTGVLKPVEAARAIADALALPRIA